MDLKNDFVLVVLDAELLSKFSQNWIVLCKALVSARSSGGEGERERNFFSDL